MADEHPLLNDLRMRASVLGNRLFRNNVGRGWIGKATKWHGGDVTIHNARPLHAGLCTGSSDLIGWTVRTITPDMVGQKVAIFTAVEAKTVNEKTGRMVHVTMDQERFLQTVNDAGGIGLIATDASDLTS